jgi:uncharacterized repeat protein (TIGR03803 family)
VRACVVFTTIFDPVVLDTYYDNFRKFGRLEQVQVIVIPDRKTPEIAWTRCREMSQRGLRTYCPTPDEQDSFLKSLGLKPDFIPYLSDNRRNVGYLMALQEDCDFVISLDDDNYARDEEDAFHEHSVVASGPTVYEVRESSTGFYNACDLLECENGARDVYPRGYPFFARHQERSISSHSVRGEIQVNTGLWLQDPDVEAIACLVQNPHIKGFPGWQDSDFRIIQHWRRNRFQDHLAWDNSAADCQQPAWYTGIQDGYLEARDGPHNFCAQPGCTDRVAAYAGVLRGSAGNLYGITYYGGVSGYGTVYKLDSAGTQTVLCNFMGGAGRAYPYAGVTQDHKGSLYGTTIFGGENLFGVVFKLEPE